MQVILLEKIGRLGNIGDQVEVKAGFGRNFLVPQGKAIPATEKNIARFEERRAELEAAAADKLTSAQGRAKLIGDLSDITITAHASEEGKLFGSVGTREISEALAAAGQEVSKSEVLLPEGVIRELGEFEIDIQLHSDVIQTIRLVIGAK